jgi:hypothetical protein
MIDVVVLSRRGQKKEKEKETIRICKLMDLPCKNTQHQFPYGTPIRCLGSGASWLEASPVGFFLPVSSYSLHSSLSCSMQGIIQTCRYLVVPTVLGRLGRLSTRRDWPTRARAICSFLQSPSSSSVQNR